MAHCVALGLGLYEPDAPEATFNRLDLAVFGLLLVYLTLVLVVVRARRTAGWFLLATAAVFVLTIGSEMLVRKAHPPEPARLPRLPLRVEPRVSDQFTDRAGETYSFSVNSLGLRGPEVDYRATDLRILCLGGSATECPLVSDEETWPWALQDQLADKLGQGVFVGNAGRSGHWTLHHEYLLSNYVDVLNEFTGADQPPFQWVIVLCGLDDWGNVLTVEEAASVETYYGSPAPDALSDTVRSPLYYRQLGLARLLAKSRRQLEDPAGQKLLAARKVRQEAVAAGNMIEELPAELERWLSVYRTNLRAIITACQARGMKPLFLTQPTLYRLKLAAGAEDLLGVCDRRTGSAYSLPVMVQLMGAYNRVMVEVCTSEGVDYVNLARLVPKTTEAFLDDCTFTPAGCRFVADTLAEYLQKSIRD